MSLVAELQRRSVFKVGAAYLVVGWLLIQIAATVAPQMDLPGWAPRFITLLVALGFPVALLLAWAFELTPEGVKVETSGVGTKRMVTIAAALAAIVLGWYLRAPSSGGEGATADARSIAVLPFVNMSGEKDNEFFSDGISEEILNSLAQMPDVKVAARTSSFSFKGQQKEIPDIARELEVRMVLEGSVRKQGERVRVTAQLIDAERGFHLWSQTYDRDLKDIFAIQGEIAQAIAKELEVKLSATQAEGLATADTKDLAAYDDYLKGMQLWQARGSDNVRAAEKLLRAALARDPTFAKAWAGLAVTMVILPEWTTEPIAPAWLAARDAAEHAIALDPTLPEPYTAIAYIAMSERRFATGRAMFARAHALAPSYATAWQWHGEALASEGALAESLVTLRRAVQLDPKSPIVRQALVNTLSTMGRDREAVEICEAVLREQPDWLPCSDSLFDAAVSRGDHAAARALLTQMAADRGAEGVALAEAMSDALEGKRPAGPVAAQLAPLEDGTAVPVSASPLSDIDVIVWLVAVGQYPVAIQRLERNIARVPHAARFLFFDVHFAPLACLPRYAELARGMALPETHAAEQCALSKRPRAAEPSAPPKKS